MAKRVGVGGVDLLKRFFTVEFRVKPLLPNAAHTLASLGVVEEVGNRLAKRSKEFSRRLAKWMEQQGDEGDATERMAKSRQPRERPWSKKGIYYKPK